MNKPIVLAASVVTIVAGVFTVAEYFKSEPSEVRAQNGIAAGGNMDVKGDVSVNTFDFDAQAASEARTYVAGARESCSKLASRFQALTVDSSLDPFSIAQYSTIDLYPPQQVAEHFGEQALATINDKIRLIDDRSMPVMQVLAENMAASTIRAGGSTRRESEGRTQFAASRRSLVDGANDLCGYLARLNK